MARRRRQPARIACAASVLAAALVVPATADPTCPLLEVQLVPDDGLQLVGWIEHAAGGYVDTLFMTEATARRGLGNRPGVMDQQTGPRWPAGPRLDVFPVWAHQHGATFPWVAYQRGDGEPGDSPSDPDRDLSHPIGVSSIEPYYCAPVPPNEFRWDACSGASVVYTDKGRLLDTKRSRYPPRSDLVWDPRFDHPSIEELAAHNPFDAISHATPAGGQPYTARWVAAALAPGGYVLRVEVSKERDFNATYSPITQPPIEETWPQFGVPYRGQPSIVFEVPFELGAAMSNRAHAYDYAGYGAPDGGDGELRAPDATITTDTPGSGAQRLLLVIEPGTPHRVRVTARPDFARPSVPSELEVVHVDEVSATIAFRAPAVDEPARRVATYEVRLRAGPPLTASDFATAPLYAGPLVPDSPGAAQQLVLDKLEPSTTYTLGIRAYDECGRAGPLATLAFTTDGATGCGSCASSGPHGLAWLALLVPWWRARWRGRRSRSR
jgi:hypothetical protein